MQMTTDVKIYQWETGFDEIPQEIASHFSPTERLAYDQREDVFSQLASECKYEPLNKLFEAISGVDSFCVHMRRENSEPFIIHFGFSFAERDDYVKFRLPSDMPLPGNPPQFLVELYKSTGGILEDFPFQRGWEAPEEMVSLADYCSYLELEPGIDPAEAYCVLSFGNGDVAGYLSNGEGFLLDHETGEIEEFDLEAVAEMYFGDYFNRYGDEYEEYEEEDEEDEEDQ